MGYLKSTRERLSNYGVPTRVVHALENCSTVNVASSTSILLTAIKEEPSSIVLTILSYIDRKYSLEAKKDLFSSVNNKIKKFLFITFHRNDSMIFKRALEIANMLPLEVYIDNSGNTILNEILKFGTKEDIDDLISVMSEDTFNRLRKHKNFKGSAIDDYAKEIGELEMLAYLDERQEEGYFKTKGNGSIKLEDLII